MTASPAWRDIEDKQGLEVLNGKALDGLLGTERVELEGGISQALQKHCLKMKGSFMNEEGTAVDYAGLRKSEDWNEFLKLTRELRECEIPVDDEDEKKVFWINLYNVLMIHGVVERGDLDRHPIQQGMSAGNLFLYCCTFGMYKQANPTGFFDRVAYVVGGHRFSLDEIEHGILRKNSKKVHPAVPPFKDGDARLKFAVETVDPRLHFALVCGAKSCPPIQVYTTKNAERGLGLAAKSFCTQEVVVDEENLTIETSKIFEWYGVDFGPTPTDIIKCLVKYANIELKNDVEKYTLQFKKYDWSLNK